MIPNDTILDAARQIGDAPVDRLIGPMGREIWTLNMHLAQVTRDDQPLPQTILPELHALILPALPPWADIYRLRRAQAFARENLFGITVALFCASLPMSYTARAGARILCLTGRLKGDVDRRIHETARFMLDVLEPGGFDAGGAGRIACGKVRLIHSAVRTAILARGSETETPVNQEDQAGTLGLFAITVLKSLMRLGARVTPADREDYVYLWRVVGSMLGVEERFLPTSYEQGDALLRRIRARQCGPTEDGVVLMRILLERMEEHLLVPAFNHAPRALVRYLIGDDYSDWLGIPAMESPEAMKRVVASASKLSQAVGHKLIHLLTEVQIGKRPVLFPMPTRDE